jgi:hypothetical protein
MSPDTTPPAGIKLLPGKMPETKTLDEWLAALPAWLQELIELTPAQRKQRLDDRNWYGAPELRRKIIRGDWAGLKADHEEEVRAIRKAPRQTQFVLLQSATCNPGSRPPTKAEAQAFARHWAERNADAAAQQEREAQAAEKRAEAEQYGFTYPVDATQGVSFQEALPWTAGCAGPHKRGYRDVDNFRAWLQRAEYPYITIGRITRKGFERVLQAERAKVCAYQTAWRRARLDALANQGPKIACRCLGCGQPLVQPDRGRQRQYCTTKCRQTAYRNRRHE